MKILFYCRSFYPDTGGMETVAKLLARGLVELGTEVKLLTNTSLNKFPELEEGFEIIRNPEKRIVLKLMSWCHIFFQHSISLRGVWPLLLFRRKWLVLHHFTYYSSSGEINMPGRIKRMISFLTINISCSEFVNSSLGKQGTIILNPFDDSVFNENNRINRQKDILFAGRLVPDKNCELLIRSVVLLHQKYQQPVHLTIAGDGPEFCMIQKLICTNKLQSCVEMTGMLTDSALAAEMRMHKVLAMPSKKEPFGLVALEGIACGCIPVVGTDGGLMESSGGFGLDFQPDNVESLARQILFAIKHPEYCNPDQNDLARFISSRKYRNVSIQYLDFLKTITRHEIP